MSLDKQLSRTIDSAVAEQIAEQGVADVTQIFSDIEREQPEKVDEAIYALGKIALVNQIDMKADRQFRKLAKDTGQGELPGFSTNADGKRIRQSAAYMTRSEATKRYEQRLQSGRTRIKNAEIFWNEYKAARQKLEDVAANKAGSEMTEAAKAQSPRKQAKK